uniref:Gustatory receptor n=1 Tax=Tetranychus urticae TaxID=32264 RepID=T1KS25_TETUR
MKQKFVKSRPAIFFLKLIKFIHQIVVHRFYGYDFKQLSIESTEALEHRFKFYFALTNGFDQNIDKIIEMEQKINFGTWLIRFGYLVSMLRAIAIINIHDETAIYFGDSAYGSNDRDYLWIVIIVGVTVMVMCHEIVLIVEKKGGFVGEPSRIKVLLKNGFSHFPFVKPRQKDFCRFFYLLSAFHNIALTMLVPYIVILYNYELCICIYNYFSLKTIICEIVWTLTLTPLVIYLAVQELCYGSLFYIYVGVFYFHMNSLKNATSWLLESIDKPQNTDIKFIAKNALLLFNKMDSYSSKVRSLVLYFYTGVAFQSLWFIHFSIIVGNHSVVMDILIALLGIFIILYNLIISLFSAQLNNKVRSLYSMWHKIYCKSKSNAIMKLKMIEILNRITLSSTGVQIGDFGLITNQFVLVFFLEFVSTIMMFKVNFGSFFAKQ